MNKYQVKETAVINAPEARVYAIISDYETGHPAILPPRYFTSMQVIEGGQGAGSVVKVEMSVYGSKSSLILTVSEPEPGRILQEEDAKAGVVTTFTVESSPEQSHTQVTIETVFQAKRGPLGWLEKKITGAITRRIYREELGLLTAVAENNAIFQP